MSTSWRTNERTGDKEQNTYWRERV